MKPDEQQITIDLTGSKGLAPRFFADKPYSVPTPNLRYVAQDGMTVGGTYNPFRRAGFMSPSTTGTANVTITSNSLFTPTTAWEYDAINQNVYFATGLIVASGNASLTTFTTTHTITGLVQGQVKDMQIYQVNNKRTLMVMFNTSSEGRIATLDLDHAGGWTNNYLGTGGTVSGTFGLSTLATKMISADNSYMYILDNNAVHKLDGTGAGGTNGTVTANVLTFPFWMSLTDGLDFGGNLYMGLQDSQSGTAYVNYTGFCGVYIWDRQSTTFGFQNFVVIPQAHFIRKLYISAAGKVRAIITLNSNETAIMEYNGVTFETITRLGITSFPQYFDSAQLVDTGIWWMTYDGQVFYYGNPLSELNGNTVDATGNVAADQESLYNIGNFTTGLTGDLALGGTLFYASTTNDWSGGIPPTGARISPEGFYISYQDVTTNTYLMKKWYPHADASSSLLSTSATDIGNVYYPVKNLPIYSSVDFVKIACVPLPDDGAGNTTTVATVKVFYNMSTTPASTVVITRNKCLSGAVDIPCAKQGVWAIQLKIEYNVAQNVGIYDFQPFVAVVNYSPSPKRR